MDETRAYPIVLTDEDLARAARFRVGRQIRSRSFFLVVLALMIGGFVVAMLVDSRRRIMPAVILALAGGGAGVLGGVIVPFIVAPRAARRNFQRNAGYYEQVTSLEITETSLNFTGPHSQSNVPFSQYLRYEESPDAFLFFMTDKFYLLIPKRVLPPEAETALRARLHLVGTDYVARP